MHCLLYLHVWVSLRRLSSLYFWLWHAVISDHLVLVAQSAVSSWFHCHGNTIKFTLNIYLSSRESSTIWSTCAQCSAEFSAEYTQKTVQTVITCHLHTVIDKITKSSVFYNILKLLYHYCTAITLHQCIIEITMV